MYVCSCYFLQDILPNTPSTGVEAVGIERQKNRFISTKPPPPNRHQISQETTYVLTIHKRTFYLKINRNLRPRVKKMKMEKKTL